MSVKILVGEVTAMLRTLPADSVDTVITSPPYWGLRSYLPDDHPDKPLEIGLERTLGEHLSVMVGVFDEVRRVMKPQATLWLNYGDCYATSPNGRSAADTKAAGNDDRTFRDKPFSTVGPIYDPDGGQKGGGHRGDKKRKAAAGDAPSGRVVAGGALKPKDLCMIPNRLAIALQDAGWWVRSEIIWGKSNPMPDSSGKYRPSTAHEKIWLLTKSAKSYYDALAVALPCSDSTHARLSQDVQNQIGSERANGGPKTNGNVKAVRRRDTMAAARPPGQRPHSLSKFEAKKIDQAVAKQDGHGRRHEGFNERWDRKVAESGSGIRNNESMNAALAIMPDTRYLRNYEPAPLTVWEMATQPFSEAHFATFAPELVERAIKAGCPEGGLILDPFFGAGTTGLVADRMGRSCIGIELNEEYAALAMRRIKGDSPLFAEVE